MFFMRKPCLFISKLLTLRQGLSSTPSIAGGKYRRHDPRPESASQGAVYRLFRSANLPVGLALLVVFCWRYSRLFFGFR
jgi:hypothetical protein